VYFRLVRFAKSISAILFGEFSDMLCPQLALMPNFSSHKGA
jgi:hypothetical protein